MPQILPKQFQVNARFDQMGGVAVAQGVNASSFRHTALFQRRAKGFLHPAAIHRCVAPIISSRKQPLRMAVVLPESPQLRQRRFRQGHITVFVSLPVADV